MSKKSCTFCGRKGLFFYPVRYAIASPAGAARAPELAGNFRIENAPQTVATAKYTLRAVRTGYLYTYDEKRDRLKAYVVMPEGHLWNFPPDRSPPDTKYFKFNCSDAVDVALSMCVDVAHSDDNPAGVFWLGWSNILWTPTLLQKAKEDAEWRRKHMRAVDIPWLLTRLPDVHVGEFSENYKNISHFSMTVKEMQTAFGFSNTPISHEMWRKNKASEFIQVFSRQSPQNGAHIVALDDPVGIANDLSELTIPTEYSGFNSELYRGRIIEEILRSTESAVRAKARRDFDFDVKQKKIDDQISDGESITYSNMKDIFATFKAGGSDALAKREAAERKIYGESSAGERRAAEERAWAELTVCDSQPVLDAQKRAAFPELYQAQLKEFEKKGEALAKSHAEWLASVQLARWMDGTHDQNDLPSGFSYRDSLAQCVGKAASTIACDKQLQQWLKSGDIANTNNLYARAMLFNQSSIIDAAAPQVKGGDVKPKHLLSIYKKSLERLKKDQELKLIDKLIFTTANTMIKALGQSSSVVMKNLVLANLSFLSKSVIEPSSLTPMQIRDWILDEAQKSGVQLETGVLKTRADALLVGRNVPSRAATDPGVCAYTLDVVQLEEGRITAGTLKKVKIPGYSNTVKWLGSSADFNIGSVAVILQLFAFSFALRDYKISDQFGSTTAFMKLGIAVSSVSGSLLELVGNGLEKAPTHPLSTAIKEHWATGPTAGKKILQAGKRTGALAGLATAALDISLSYKAFLDKDYALSGLYFANAVLGASLAVAGYFSCAIFWPLFLAAFSLSIVIALVKSSALKKWISHCYFSAGSTSESRYSSLDDELSALRGALGN